MRESKARAIRGRGTRETARWSDSPRGDDTARSSIPIVPEKLLKKSSACFRRSKVSIVFHIWICIIVLYVLQGAESDGRAKLFGSLKLKPTYTTDCWKHSAAASRTSPCYSCTPCCLIGWSIGSGRYTWRGWMGQSVSMDLSRTMTDHRSVRQCWVRNVGWSLRSLLPASRVNVAWPEAIDCCPRRHRWRDDSVIVSFPVY
jgi:hypothetical protein